MCDENVARAAPGEILLRADAGEHRGLGHVMRCVTLGAELADRGHRVSLLGSEIPELAARRAKRAGIRVEPLVAPIGGHLDAQSLVDREPDFTVVDGYEFGPDYFRLLDDAGVRYMVIDDTGDVAPRGSRLILNQNLHATRSMYPHIDDHRLLLGTQYALVRREVRCQQAHRSRRRSSERPMILVAIGGTDVLRLGAVVATSILEHGEVDVVVAGDDVPPGATKAPADIAECLAQATVAVIGAGSTMWEACCLGIPSVALVVADNQAHNADCLRRHGLGVVIDCRESFDPAASTEVTLSLLIDSARLDMMARVGQRLVDGNGVRRVALALEEALAA